jgi:hypothetical protein
MALAGTTAGSKALHPAIEDVKPVPGGVEFHFELAPGTYEAAVSFGNELCNANGPLVILPGVDRHLFVAGVQAVMDWHARLALAGTVPVDGMVVKVVVLTRPAKCGDNPRSYEHEEESGTVDQGVYYANVYGYEEQDQKVALVLSGALFTERTVLVTQPLGGKNHGHDLVVKNLTPDVIQAAVTSPNKFACASGF